MICEYFNSFPCYFNDLNCLRTCPGYVIPLQVVSMKQLGSNSIICQPKKSFKCSSRRFASLTHDGRNYENMTIRNHDIAKKCRLGATYKHEYASKSNDDNSTSFLTVLSKALKAFYLFSRPHTVIGTVSYISLHYLRKNHLTTFFFLGFLLRDNKNLTIVNFVSLLFFRL